MVRQSLLSSSVRQSRYVVAPAACIDRTRRILVGRYRLILPANWGPCPGFEELDDPLSLAELLENAELTDEQWSEFVNVMTTGTEPEKANYLCWMENYFALCDPCPTCPDSDPFGE